MQLIYCVEDDEDIRGLVTYALKSSGYEAAGFCDAKSFLDGFYKKTPDLAVVDIMLPDTDGLEILKKLRDEKYNTPVIMLTAKSGEMDKVKSFELGADDYITKPFSVLELVSRVKAVLKRSGANKAAALEYNGISLDTEMRTAAADGKKMTLTYKEFELLEYLMENRGKAVSREVLLNRVWGYCTECESRTLDVHIGNLRRKLGGRGKMIETIRNVGYILR